MFPAQKTAFSRLLDGIDLALDLATLGEYGLEPVEPARQACRRIPADQEHACGDLFRSRRAASVWESGTEVLATV